MNPEYLSLNVNRLAKRWWVLVVRGVAAMLFGLFTILLPGLSLLAMILLWGAYAIVEGVFSLVLAARGSGAGESWGWMVFGGVVSIFVGLFTFAWPRVTTMALLLVIAAWAVVTGIAEVLIAVRLRKQIKGEWMLATSGILSIAFGVLLVVFPGSGILTVAWMVAAWAFAFGALLVGLGLRLNRWRGDLDRTMPAGGAHPA